MKIKFLLLFFALTFLNIFSAEHKSASNKITLVIHFYDEKYSFWGVCCSRFCSCKDMPHKIYEIEIQGKSIKRVDLESRIQEQISQIYIKEIELRDDADNKITYDELYFNDYGCDQYIIMNAWLADDDNDKKE